jgi:hypothetical protein
MHRLLQGAIPEIEIRADLIHIAEQDKLVSAVTEERLSMCNRAITVLARERRHRAVSRKLISVHRQEDGG